MKKRPRSEFEAGFPDEFGQRLDRSVEGRAAGNDAAFLDEHASHGRHCRVRSPPRAAAILELRRQRVGHEKSTAPSRMMRIERALVGAASRPACAHHGHVVAAEAATGMSVWPAPRRSGSLSSAINGTGKFREDSGGIAPWRSPHRARNHRAARPPAATILAKGDALHDVARHLPPSWRRPATSIVLVEIGPERRRRDGTKLLARQCAHGRQQARIAHVRRAQLPHRSS